MLFIAPNGSSVRFPERSNFYVGDPYHEGDLSVSALKDSRGSRGPTVPHLPRSSGQFPEWLTFYVDDL